MNLRPLWAGVLLLVGSAAVTLAGEPPATVTEVKVTGNQRTEPETVLQKVGTKAGAPYDARQVREDVRALYGLGLFRDVTVELDEGGRLTFAVVERPTLREWKVEGSEEVPKEDLEKAVPLKRRDVLTPTRVEEGSRAVRDQYREKGYYLAEVKAEVLPAEGGRNQADVVYRVSEGPEVKVKQVHLPGVGRADEGALRGTLALREVGPWSWLSGAGTFKEGDLERDRDAIRAFYLNQGFAEVKVLEPRVSLTSDRRWLKIDIPVEEGEAFDVGKVTFTGDLEFPETTLRSAAGLREGDVFRSDDFRRALQKLSDLYADIGYAFVDLDPDTQVDRAARKLSVTFRIRKGDRVRIGRIEVRGNTKTRDRVVRREMRLAEGTLYSASAIRKSRQKIENLGFFEKVNLTTNRRPGTNLVDVDIEVEEKPTGSFSVGAGYSSVDKIVGMASVSQRNFLGLGYQLSLNANVGGSRESYAFTFNNPRVYDSEWYLGGDFFKAYREYSDYDKASLGGDVKIGRSLGEDWRTRWIYRWERADVSLNDPNTASNLLRDQEGVSRSSALSASLTHDSRDNPWEPHAGSLVEGSVEWSGSLFGGTWSYLKYDLEASKYFGLWWKHVLTVHGQIGYLQALETGGVPVFERYYLGGISSVRGFASQDIGPTEPDYYGNDEVVGGTKMLLFNVEYLFPLIEEAKLRGVLFFDAGNAWNERQPYLADNDRGPRLRTGAGYGVRWFSPMGPLRLEYAYNLNPEPGEDKSRWEFSIGGFF